ncbi:tape measure protein [Escherichia coli]|uniref:tape measure protein n=3 Tax=Escherichia coli TaxID=562 RepID=UPI001F150768|nr:tape measure protein [Escherichia coli]HCL7862760.1 tape measure protein [Escherichia coli]HCS4775394.1 tape measure protein [Escherichia coli]HCS4785231.1 tape measure protein [Escherichia coli]HCS5529422.1 tape measure protein [Escherichia coli]HCS5553612.1 tape measure protein [Escherichia coli]
MAMKEVARLTNVIYWDSDKSSWRKEVKRLEDYKKSWKKATDDIAKADFKSNQAVLRTQRTRAKVEEQIARAQKKQRAQAVSRLTGGNNPELSSMRKFYQQQAREAARQQKLLDRSVGDVQHRKARVGANSARISSMFDGSLVAQFQSRIQRVNADYAKGAINLQTYNQKMARLRAEMKMATAEAGKFQSRLDKLASGASKVHDNLGKLNSTLGKIAIGLTAAGWGVQRAVSGAMGSLADRNSAYFGLMAQNKDDKAKTDQQMAYVKRISYDYGMDQRETEGGFMRFAAATPSIEEKDKQALFEAMAIKGRSVGATADQQNRAIVALGQIYSKGGRVYAEELKGQLSEALAGSQVDFTKAAIDAGVIKKEEEFNKALEDGKITMDKLLPSLVKIWSAAKNTKAFAESMKQPEVAMQRMKNSFNELAIQFMGVVDPADGVISLSESLISIFEDLTTDMDGSGSAAKQFGEAVGAAMREIMYWVGFAKGYIEVKAKEFGMTSEEVGGWIGKLVVAIAGLKIIGTLLSPFTGLISLVTQLIALLGKIPGMSKLLASASGGTATGAAVISAGSNAERSFIDGKTQEMSKENSKQGALFELGRFVSNAGALFTPGGDTGPLFDQVRGWFNKGPTLTVDTGIRPTPTGGIAIQNGGYQPVQVNVAPQGEISGKWEITIDEGGIARVIQKEVSDQLDWKATQESNQLF